MIKVWTLTDGHPGMESQVRGLAETLEATCVFKKATRKAPWSFLPSTWNWGALAHLTLSSDPLTPPYPDVLISAGRRAIPLSLALKRENPSLFYIHIQDPRISPRYFDQIIVPAHDRLRGSNVLVSQGALHHLTHEKLAQARTIGEKLFAPYPRPLVVLLLGGTTNRYRFTPQTEQALLGAIDHILNTEGTLIILSSFRTPLSCKEQIRKKAAEYSSRIFFYDGTGFNPYLASFAVADYIVVTNDSVNMMSEACFTGKPVYLFSLPGHKDTPPVRCGEDFIHKGLARPFQIPFEKWGYSPLNETARIGEILRQKLENFLKKSKNLSC